MGREQDAFPHQSYTREYKGMKLRDYFAGQVMIGICGNDGVCGFGSTKIFNLDIGLEREALAFKCYQMADAMMKAGGYESEVSDG